MVRSAPSRGRVLVADWDAKQREVVQRSLLASGFDVDGVGDGQEALRYLDRSSPQLAIVELLLPGLDGIPLLRAIQAKAGENLPIIVATARDDPGTMIEATALGARAYLTKPYATSELVALVDRIIPR